MRDQRVRGSGERKSVALEEELGEEADAQRKDVAFSDDNAFTIALEEAISSICQLHRAKQY